MRKNPVEMSLLFDYYGEMLTEKQIEIYDQYYNADLSLAEIAENFDISRQGVHDLLSRAEKSLRVMEEKLQFVARYQARRERAAQINGWLDDMETLNTRSLSSAQLESNIQRVRAAVGEILE